MMLTPLGAPAAVVRFTLAATCSGPIGARRTRRPGSNRSGLYRRNWRWL